MGSRFCQGWPQQNKHIASGHTSITNPRCHEPTIQQSVDEREMFSMATRDFYRGRIFTPLVQTPARPRIYKDERYFRRQPTTTLKKKFQQTESVADSFPAPCCAGNRRATNGETRDSGCVGLHAQNVKTKYPGYLVSPQCKTYDAPRERLGEERCDLEFRCWALLRFCSAGMGPC